MADNKDEKEEKTAGKEILSNKAAALIIIALLILGVMMIYGKNAKKSVSQTRTSWTYQEEKFWDRGKFSSVPANSVVIEPNFISFSIYGTKEKFKTRCIRVNPRSMKYVCSFSGKNDRLASGPDDVRLKKINNFLYEGYDKEIVYEGKRYKNIRIKLKGN